MLSDTVYINYFDKHAVSVHLSRQYFDVQNNLQIKLNIAPCIPGIRTWEVRYIFRKQRNSIIREYRPRRVQT